MTRRRDIFAVGRGQYENIGDGLLRRPLLDWAREAGRLHVYVGKSPEGYDEGLGVRGDDVVYRSLSSWYLALLKAAAAGGADSLYKPGEIQLSLIGMKEHIVMLPAVALVRLRGGKVARIGAGARSFAPLPRALMWPSNRLSSMTRWRDQGTADYLGFGPAMPDLGYFDGMPDADLLASLEGDGAERDLLVVSLREDEEVAPRPYPTQSWFEGVREAAARLGLGICVVTQVSVDDDRSRRLAAELEAELVSWPEPINHAPQEAALRAVYRRARVVASDRLHVVIAGLTEGAAPVGLLLNDDDKISRHFATIGVEDIAFNAIGLTSDRIAESIVKIAGERDVAIRAVIAARQRLRAVRDELLSLLQRNDSEKLVEVSHA